MTYFEEAKQILAKVLLENGAYGLNDHLRAPKSWQQNKPAIWAYKRAWGFWRKQVIEGKAEATLSKFQFRQIPDRASKGQSKVQQANQDTYRRFWESCEKSHGGVRDENGGLWLFCAECTAAGQAQRIPYAAAHCSHIISKGAHPAIAHDLDNLEVLCLDHHRQWEDSHARKSMRIYPELQKRRRELLQRHLIDKT